MSKGFVGHCANSTFWAITVPSKASKNRTSGGWKRVIIADAMDVATLSVCVNQGSNVALRPQYDPT